MNEPVVAAKPFYLSKMNWLGVLTALLGVLEALQQTDLLQQHPSILVWLGAAIVVLRSVTTTKIKI